MANFYIRNRTIGGKGLFRRIVSHYLRYRRGNIAATVAVLLVPLVGIMGVATETSSWFFTQRAAQNAADSAVLAAATNGGNGQSDYATEATQVAAKFGFTSSMVTVPAPATYASVTPCSASACYKVSITKQIPINLVKLLGYRGTGGSGQQTISAFALANTKTVNAPFCLLALGTTGGKKGDDITANGVASSTIACNLLSNSTSNCNGHSLTSGYSDSVGTTNDCGSKQHTGVTAGTDPYQSVLNSTNVPGQACNNPYPDSNSNWSAATNGIGSASVTTVTLPAIKYYCGDVRIGSNVTVNTATGGSVIVIENGLLDLQGFTLSASGSNGLTIVFTSATPGQAISKSGYNYAVGGQVNNDSKGNNLIVGSGTLDIAAPTSGTWQGVALLQDNNLPETQVTYTGNSPTLDITGAVDLPVTDLTAKGAINKSTGGYACLTLVVNTLLISGTGDLFYQNAQSQCPQAGVTQITNQAYVIGQLVD